MLQKTIFKHGKKAVYKMHLQRKIDVRKYYKGRRLEIIYNNNQVR